MNGVSTPSPQTKVPLPAFRPKCNGSAALTKSRGFATVAATLEYSYRLNVELIGSDRSQPQVDRLGSSNSVVCRWTCGIWAGQFRGQSGGLDRRAPHVAQMVEKDSRRDCNVERIGASSHRDRKLTSIDRCPTHFAQESRPCFSLPNSRPILDAIASRVERFSGRIRTVARRAQSGTTFCQPPQIRFARQIGRFDDRQGERGPHRDAKHSPGKGISTQQNPRSSPDRPKPAHSRMIAPMFSGSFTFGQTGANARRRAASRARVSSGGLGCRKPQARTPV